MFNHHKTYFTHISCFIIFLITLNLSVIAQDIQLQHKLVGQYELDGEIKDLSGREYHGDSYGGTLQTNRFEQLNNAIALDRKSFIKISSFFPEIKNEVSIAFWILTVEDSIQTIASKYFVNGGIGHGFRITLEDGKVVFGGRDGSTNYRSSGLSSTIINDSTWHFIAGICRTGNWEIWVDGSKENEYQSDYKYVNLSNSQSLILGNAPQLKENFFTGLLDDLSIYSRALNQAEIQLLYKSGNITAKEEIAMRVEGSMTVWEKRGTYEKTEDYVKRVNPSTRLVRREELTETAIQEMGHERIKWKYLTYEYDADTEKLALNFEGFEPYFMNMPVELARHYDIANFHSLNFENVKFGLTERGDLTIVQLEITK